MLLSGAPTPTPGATTGPAPVCGVCTTAESRYRCPRCGIMYCTVACYRAHGAAERAGTCAEAFRADHAEAQLRVVRVAEHDPERLALLDILKRDAAQAELDQQQYEQLLTASEATEAAVARLTDAVAALSSGDGGGGGGHEADVDAVLRSLPDDVQRDFCRAMHDGRLSALVEPWTPWWLSTPALVEMMLDTTTAPRPGDGHSGTKEHQRGRHLPATTEHAPRQPGVTEEEESELADESAGFAEAVYDGPLDVQPFYVAPALRSSHGRESPRWWGHAVPALKSLAVVCPRGASPLLRLGALELVFAHVFVMRRFNGDPFSAECRPEAAGVVAALAPAVLGPGALPYVCVADALAASRQAAACSPAVRADRALVEAAVADVATLLERRARAGGVLRVVVELQRLMALDGDTDGSGERVAYSPSPKKKLTAPQRRQHAALVQKLYFYMCWAAAQPAAAWLALAAEVSAEVLRPV